MTVRLILALVVASSQAQALTLPTDASQTATTTAALESFDLPVGPYADGAIKRLSVEGTVTHTAWRIGNGGATTLQLLLPLRDQLTRDGYKILFDCADRACGGFDFRYDTHVLPEPEMHVDLGDFRYVAAAKPEGDATDYVSLLVSRSSQNGFIQVTRVGQPSLEPVAVAASTKTPTALPQAELLQDAASGDKIGTPGRIAAELEASGAMSLDDLVFASGSSELGEGDFASLAELADYLLADPQRKVTLVGHSDAEGALASNIAISKRRAESVANRLIGAYAVPRGQVQAEGVGYLAPRSSNLHGEGRTQNRRVEVVLSSVD